VAAVQCFEIEIKCPAGFILQIKVRFLEFYKISQVPGLENIFFFLAAKF
jgi:hypothetical protein